MRLPSIAEWKARMRRRQGSDGHGDATLVAERSVVLGVLVHRANEGLETTISSLPRFAPLTEDATYRALTALHHAGLVDIAFGSGPEADAPVKPTHMVAVTLWPMLPGSRRSVPLALRRA